MKKLTCVTALLLLGTMFFLALSTLKDDTFTFDEVAHVAAGYSYLVKQDYRMNPEHPPLIKDIAALPLLFVDLYTDRSPDFLAGNEIWENASPAVWWHQFNFGFQFLYHYGNNPDKILFWTRLPMIFVMLLLGLFIFFWSRKLWGDKAALLALFLYAFSPTFLAHGRLVTTDVGAAFGTVLAAFFWLNFLKKPSKKNIFLAGIFFGIAMLVKFSLILLLPFFAIITLIYAWLQDGKKLKNIFKYVLLSILGGIVGLVFVIWPVYQFHVFGYPPERQIQDTKDLLATTNVKFLTGFNVWLEENPITRPLGQYLLGLLTATNRTATGNTTYFLGQISADSWRSYFPIVYFIKNPLPFNILTIVALFYALWKIKRPWWENAYRRKMEWIKSHFAEFSMLIFLGIYWLTSILSNLNIGVRHLMPVFPFTIMLVAAGISMWLRESHLKLKSVLVGLLLLWQGISVIFVFPYFIAYFNEAVGGPSQGYKYVVDSNLDWGQDLKRLEAWMSENGVDKIYLDYFGGGDMGYYLGEKYVPWWAQKDKNELPSGSYLAVSANQLQGQRAEAVKGFDCDPFTETTDCLNYRWLDSYEPVTVIGYSIFVFLIN